MRRTGGTESRETKGAETDEGFGWGMKMLSAEVHLQKMCNRNFIPQNVRSHILPSKNTEQVVLVPTTCFYLQLRNTQICVLNSGNGVILDGLVIVYTSNSIFLSTGPVLFPICHFSPFQSAMADDATRRAVSEIPLLKTNSGPRDKELWVQRLREEYLALIKVGPGRDTDRGR